MFGIIAARIFLNIAEKRFFIGRMESHHFYRFYANWTKKLFDYCCNNVSEKYADEAISYLKPFEHYGASHFKICNLNYVYYLEKLNK